MKLESKMREIKLKIVDWWDQKEEQNYFFKFLSKRYKVTLSDNPDYLICSLFGHQFLEYDCTKILFTGENVVPDFNLYDYAMGFHDLNLNNRYLRYPLFILYAQDFLKAQEKHKNLNSQTLLNRDFCSFVVSNGDADFIREQFFDLLSQKEFIASGGRFKNNIGKPVEDKMAFLQSYKFNIAFENSRGYGYCTEKLIQALGAQTVPIYWGDPYQISGNDFQRSFINPKSFINIDSFNSLDEAIEHILQVHQDSKLYMQYLQEPAFLIENIQEHYEKQLEEFFEFIFSKPTRHRNAHICETYGSFLDNFILTDNKDSSNVPPPHLQKQEHLISFFKKFLKKF